MQPVSCGLNIELKHGRKVAVSQRGVVVVKKEQIVLAVLAFPRLQMALPSPAKSMVLTSRVRAPTSDNVWTLVKPAGQ